MKIRICCTCLQDYSIALKDLANVEILKCPSCGESVHPTMMNRLRELALCLIQLQAYKDKWEDTKTRLILLDISNSVDQSFSSPGVTNTTVPLEVIRLC